MTAAADACLRVADLALAFGRIDRSVVSHPNGTPESDTDHTVALAWLAPAIAAATEPGLDPCRVAAYAAVHDAVEVFAGDTPTIRALTGSQQAAKHEREQDAVLRWDYEIGTVLSWLPVMISAYERRVDKEARYVWAADKLAPKLVHLLNGARDLRAAGVTAEAFRHMITRQRAALDVYAGEFTGLLAVYDEVCARVIRHLEDQNETTGAALWSRTYTRVQPAQFCVSTQATATRPSR